jgi:hypothetical protein
MLYSQTSLPILARTMNDQDRERLTEEVESVVDDLSTIEDSSSLLSFVIEPGLIAHIPSLIGGFQQPVIVTFRTPQGSGHRCQLYIEQPRRLRVFYLADCAQDVIVDSTHQPRPVCPIHQHPLNPVFNDKNSFWECPRDNRIGCEIGSYWKWRGSGDIVHRQ